MSRKRRLGVDREDKGKLRGLVSLVIFSPTEREPPEQIHPETTRLTEVYCPSSHPSLDQELTLIP